MVTIVTAHYDSAHKACLIHNKHSVSSGEDKSPVYKLTSLSSSSKTLLTNTILWIYSSSHWLWPFLYQNTGPRLLSPGYCMGYSMRFEDEEDGRVSSDGPHYLTSAEFCLSQGNMETLGSWTGNKALSTFEQSSCSVLSFPLKSNKMNDVFTLQTLLWLWWMLVSCCMYKYNVYLNKLLVI